MDYDDNFIRKGASGVTNQEGSSNINHQWDTSFVPPQNPDQLVDMVLQRLGQTYRPNHPAGYVAPTSQGRYSCGICGGPHRTELCTSYIPGANNPPTRKWCQLCCWNYTHVTRECVHIMRMAKERDYGGQALQLPLRQEQAKPVLGSQPPPPRVLLNMLNLVFKTQRGWRW